MFDSPMGFHQLAVAISSQENLAFQGVDGINSLTPILLLAGIKNYRSVEFLRRNSKFFCVF
jgi:hypothetical protein